jgi:hypothetical protein
LEADDEEREFLDHDADLGRKATKAWQETGDVMRV